MEKVICPCKASFVRYHDPGDGYLAIETHNVLRKACDHDITFSCRACQLIVFKTGRYQIAAETYLETDYMEHVTAKQHEYRPV
ncbi:MAG: hypothetical protein V3T17_13225 [Pseudomonadales bacterium]